MPRKLRIAYFVHSLRSDWNNGNAHFLRGLLNAMQKLGHEIAIFEPEQEWSIDHLREEERGKYSLQQFAMLYPDLSITTYSPSHMSDPSFLKSNLDNKEIVILHEWNSVALSQCLLTLRDNLNFSLLFHDTHHRASSSPDAMRRFGIERFDGVIAFGAALAAIYREHFKTRQVWILHEAADTDVFFPRHDCEKINDVVWIGNWGDGERSKEIQEFLLTPAAQMPQYRFYIYGVRYPSNGLDSLRDAGTSYGGYLPNLDAPGIYAQSKLTVHVPRQQYANAMNGIPTIRVFEALACGIPLISAPWQDTENLFRDGDFAWARDGGEMIKTMRALLDDSTLASDHAARGQETVLSRHTCLHRAKELTSICEELLD